MIETKFKNTELGPIPEDWEEALIGDTFTYKRNNTLSRDNLNYNDFCGIKNVHYGDVLIKFGSFIDASKETLPFINREIKINPDYLSNGDIVVADTAEDETVGKTSEIVGINPSDKIVSGLHTIVLSPQEPFAPKFLGYLMNGFHYHRTLMPHMQGTKVISITKKAIGSTTICYPKALEEQARIAEALTDMDALIAELTALIEKKRSVLKGTMQELLSARLRLPGFSVPWEEVKLGDFVSIVRGGSPRPIEAYLTTRPDGLNWIKIGDTRVGDKYITHTAERIIPEGLSSTRQVHKGDLILSNSMSFGRPYILAIDGCIHDGWLAISEYGESFDTDFFYYLLQSEDTVKQYKMLAAGSGVLNLNKAIVGDLLVFKPKSIQEQGAIAEILSDMDAEIVELEAKREKYKAVRQGMMQQLLTGKIRLI